MRQYEKTGHLCRTVRSTKIYRNTHGYLLVADTTVTATGCELIGKMGKQTARK